jgi:hypothetical protein
MKQHDRRSGPLLDVMEPHTIHVDKCALGWVAALGSASQDAIEQCGNAEPNNRRGGDSRGGRAPKNVHQFSTEVRRVDGAPQHNLEAGQRVCDAGLGIHPNALKYRSSGARLNEWC